MRSRRGLFRTQGLSIVATSLFTGAVGGDSPSGSVRVRWRTARSAGEDPQPTRKAGLFLARIATRRRDGSPFGRCPSLTTARRDSRCAGCTRESAARIVTLTWSSPRRTTSARTATPISTGGETPRSATRATATPGGKSPSTTSMSTRIAFPLIGAHAMVDCYSCHKVGTVGPFNRQGLSTECSSCHMDDFKKAKNPNHIAQGFSTQCLECHSLMDNWMTTISPMMMKRSKTGKSF